MQQLAIFDSCVSIALKAAIITLSKFINLIGASVRSIKTLLVKTQALVKYKVI
jgi:hypothetical protein